jgi:hypothetical protein
LTGFSSSRQNPTREKLGIEFLKVDNVDYFVRREVDHWILDPSRIRIRSYGSNIATT